MSTSGETRTPIICLSDRYTHPCITLALNLTEALPIGLEPILYGFGDQPTTIILQEQIKL